MQPTGGRFRSFLQSVVVGDKNGDRQAAIGAELGLSEANVNVLVHRLRRRYRELLSAEIAETVADRAEAQAELQHLMTVLRR